jgi:hypothetical protein
MSVAGSPSLDLFSTSQTKSAFLFAETCAVSAQKCIYGAPYFAFQKEGKFYGVVQGCCNHWSCPKCGLQRAKMEYGRVVYGCELLAKSHTLYFITITCRGKQLSLEEAEMGYLEWTNRFLSSCRVKQKRAGGAWYYVQVTERQKRGHPHSHILSTFDPGDCHEGYVEKWKNIRGCTTLTRKSALRSDWLQNAVVLAGLGDQYDISVVKTASAASRYVAKYLFKNTMFSLQWRKGWKRVRYSQSFPQLPDKKTDAFVLLSQADWAKLASLAAVIYTDSPETKDECLYRLAGHDILVG